MPRPLDESLGTAFGDSETVHLTPQNDQLMSENRILCLKSALRLEWPGQNGQDEAEQSEHGPHTLGDSFS